MPNLDVNIDEYVIAQVLFYDGISHQWTVLDSRATVNPLKEKRVSTNRNSPKVTGKKMKSCLAPPSYSWFRNKPQLLPGENDPVWVPPFGVKPYKERLKEWRASKHLVINAERFIRKEKRKPIPDGWKTVKLPNGEYELHVDTFFNGKYDVLSYKWSPKYVERLRPSNRTWTRHNPKVPASAKVNDLLYYKEECETIGGINFDSFDPITGNYPTSRVEAYGDLQQLQLDRYYDQTIPFVAWKPKVEAESLLTLYKSQIDDMSKLSLRRHYAKLKNQKVDLATELSQGMQTVKTIADLATRLAKSFVALKRGNLTAVAKNLFPTSLKGASNDFLMWRYGISPLIGDLKGAAEHLAEYIQRAAPVKSNGHATKLYTDYSLDTSGPLAYEVTSNVKIRVKYGTSFSVSDALTRQASMLGFTTPGQALYELTPWSFVIDWFLPIGDWIANLTALKGLELAETYKTIFIEMETSELQYLRTDLPRSVSLKCGGFLLKPTYLYSYRRRKVTFCKREVIPLPDVPKPQLKNPISAGHLANALALLTQLVSK